MNEHDNVITDRSGNGHEGKIFGAKWVPGAPFEVLKDNDVDLGDVISALKVLAGTNVTDETDSLKDINNDRKISIGDVIYMLQRIGNELIIAN